ncbi:MAG: hypothetical protein II998_03460 [Clostridia bacterium]|nr:hypothetical protein [Clostridia bacterium]
MEILFLVLAVVDFGADFSEVIDIKTNRLTGGALCSALTMVFLFAACYLPISIVLLFVSSVVSAVCILKYKTGTAIISYFAVSFLSLFILSDKLIAFAYIVIFGIYPVVKYFVEKLKNIIGEYIIKFIIWNVELFAVYVVLSAFGQEDLMSIANFWFWLGGIILLAAYDLVFGMFINGFYRTYYRFFN